MPGDAVFFCARGTRPRGRFSAVLVGKEARLFLGVLAVLTIPFLALASLTFVALSSQMTPAQWRDMLTRVRRLRPACQQGSDGNAGAHAIFSRPARERLLKCDGLRCVVYTTIFRLPSVAVPIHTVANTNSLTNQRMELPSYLQG